MGKLYLIRHGQTDSNSSKKFQGRIDIPLNDTGLLQAQKMADFFKDKNIDVIYSSPLQRAAATANALGMVKNLSIQFEDDLQEISFGDWEGLGYDTISDKWNEEIKLFFTNPELCEPPNGERFIMAQHRARAGLDKILAEHIDKDIAIVSHGGIIRGLIFSVLQIPLANFWKININNASVTTFSIWDNNFIVECINDYHYL